MSQSADLNLFRRTEVDKASNHNNFLALCIFCASITAGLHKIDYVHSVYTYVHFIG